MEVSSENYWSHLKSERVNGQGPVVRKEVSVNPGLKVKLGFDFS